MESDLSATQLGKVMDNLSYSLADEVKIQQLISDTFVRKSPATLYKRARALWKYFEWMQGGYSQSLATLESRTVLGPQLSLSLKLCTFSPV